MTPLIAKSGGAVAVAFAVEVTDLIQLVEVPGVAGVMVFMIFSYRIMKEALQSANKTSASVVEQLQAENARLIAENERLLKRLIDES